MGKTYAAIDDNISNFVQRQQLFFVATAPSGAEGHVNCSPKGLEALRILGPTTIAYVDYVGSGAETIAHLRQNGRIVIMLCAFEGPPKIVRLHGRGEVVEPSSAEYTALRSQFPVYAGARAVIRVHCERVSDACGYGVPLYEFHGHRTQLTDWAESKGPDALAAYQRQKNALSIDGLPGL